MTTKPNFFIVGAPKCGTTAWVEYLGSHPEVFFCTPKEPHHFNYDMPGYRWISSPERYLRLFEKGQNQSILGDASVFYLHSKVAASEIHRFNPSAKILVLLRDQEDFLPSLHNQLVFNGDEIIEDFEEAWRLSGNRNASNIGRFCRDMSLLNYKAAGNFSEQLERYFSAFSSEQIQIVHYRDWTRFPREAYLGMLDFLGLDDDGRTDFPRINEAQRRPFNWLTPLLRKPPAALRVLRRVSGLPRGLGVKMLQMNSQSGYISSASAALRVEIRNHYRHDRDLTESRIWRPASCPANG